jgi:hypothetical protein
LAGVDEFGSTSKIYPSTRGKGKGEKRIKEGSGVNSDTPFFSFVPATEYTTYYSYTLHTCKGTKKIAQPHASGEVIYLQRVFFLSAQRVVFLE